MIIQLKYFHHSLNIVLVLVPGREIFSAKCVQFYLTFTKKKETDIFHTIFPS